MMQLGVKCVSFVGAIDQEDTSATMLHGETAATTSVDKENY